VYCYNASGHVLFPHSGFIVDIVCHMYHYSRSSWQSVLEYQSKYRVSLYMLMQVTCIAIVHQVTCCFTTTTVIQKRVIEVTHSDIITVRQGGEDP